MARRCVEVGGAPDVLKYSEETIRLWVNLAWSHGINIDGHIEYDVDGNITVKIGRLGAVYVHEGGHTYYCGLAEEISPRKKLKTI